MADSGIGCAPLRGAARLVVFAVGSWLVVASGLSALLSRFPQRWRRTAPFNARWARLGRWCLGIRARAVGDLPAAGSLVVANHHTYADVVTLGGFVPCIFAARHDMRRWPLFGALAASGATIFVDRGNRRAGVRAVSRAATALAAGATVLAFPEGTTSDGSDMLPFRSGFFQAALEAGAPVVPAAIRYLALDGRPIAAAERSIVGWYGKESFLGHAWRLVTRRSVEAEVRFGAPLPPPHGNRRALARVAEARVRELGGFPRRDAGAGSGA
jgi:1-acyl-sn-glycerol-3-phosphate acyltransferase